MSHTTLLLAIAFLVFSNALKATILKKEPFIQILNATQAVRGITEINSEYRLVQSTHPNSGFRVCHKDGNPYLKIDFNQLNEASDFVELQVSLNGSLHARRGLPGELAQGLQGFHFRARAFDAPLTLKVSAQNLQGEVIEQNKFKLSSKDFTDYYFPTDDPKAAVLLFCISKADQHSRLNDAAFSVDDLSLFAHVPQLDIHAAYSSNDTIFLNWLKRSAIRFFIWNYCELDNGMGIVSESYLRPEKVTSSGIGYALAAYIIAEREGMLSPKECRERILAMLKWLQAQDWFDGSSGWHGFPYHYLNHSGKRLFGDVSTVDWATCAAGIRVVRQKYQADPIITQITNEILARPRWDKAIDSSNKIAMGLMAKDGNMDSFRWGLAFSEETELVYLEAVASGTVNENILNSIIRKKIAHYYPSWFGAGFTYNWLQLWTGPIEPFKTNSLHAYIQDALTCQSAFGRPLMGLTACSTVSWCDENGFIRWDKYISNQGGNIHGANKNEVIQQSPAPYGAALALPFCKDLALSALREYVAMGYHNPLLGLPDSVCLKGLPARLASSPSWNHVDINIGPMALAIDSATNNNIATLYRQDRTIQRTLRKLARSFDANFGE